MKELSAEERRHRAAKAAATNRERRERKDAADAELRRDREQALRICRAIRDDESAADADRLYAIELLRSM